jgi:non-ribosomal peptide synthetase component F
LGVRPDTLVAICVDRSIAMIVGVLAILKAGGAYVPLDPSYPTDRLVAILEDCHPSIVLADDVGRATFSEVNTFSEGMSQRMMDQSGHGDELSLLSTNKTFICNTNRSQECGCHVH